MEKIVNQPWPTIVVFVCGYIAYHIANTGVRDHHKTIDIAFATLVFGFFSVFGYYSAAIWGNFGTPASSLAAVISAILVGGFWRAFGRSWYKKTLRVTRVSESDDLPTAWQALFDETGYHVSQITVRTKSGAWLQCEDTSKFIDKPNGPCTLGAAGDILLYVTHYAKSAGDKPEELTFATYDGWGDEITYIPKEEIKRIEIRRIKKS